MAVFLPLLKILAHEKHYKRKTRSYKLQRMSLSPQGRWYTISLMAIFQAME